MRRFASLGLTGDQQARIQALVTAFSQAHPAGTPLDPEAMRELRRQVREVLTPQQAALLQQEREERGTQGGMRHERRCP